MYQYSLLVYMYMAKLCFGIQVVELNMLNKTIFQITPMTMMTGKSS